MTVNCGTGTHTFREPAPCPGERLEVAFPPEHVGIPTRTVRNVLCDLPAVAHQALFGLVGETHQKAELHVVPDIGQDPGDPGDEVRIVRPDA